MDQECQRLWWQYYQAVVDGLRRSAHPSKGKPELALLVVPAFDELKVLGLSSPSHNSVSGEYHGRTTTWNARAEREILLQPAGRLQFLRREIKPALVVSDFGLPADHCKEILACLTSLRPAIRPETARVGCDGVSFELLIGGAFAFSTFRWWVKAPDEWTELERVADELSELMDASAPKVQTP